jgi:tetratricopeptide (TPR) repeat protein
MFPRDAIAWVDLARMYTVLGLNEQAEKAIRIACNLAPQNRFVIRSAARFYAHIGEMDRAHDLVLSSGACKYDPWLAASEVALATLAKRYPRSATTGLGMISGGDFSDFDITELATAIGTLDFMNGQNHKAKKLVRRALVAPNDNSLAQAKWISRTMSGLPIDVKVSEFQIPRQFEASAYETFSLGQWRESLSASLNWCKDEPFSSRAAQMACYIAGALLEDYDFCVRIANFGLVANPEDEMLINQRAFCFASLDRIDLATEELARLKGATLTDNGRITWYANHGLVAFRSGRIDEARVWYLKAADLAASVENARYYTTALLYWAREEALRDTAACPELIERVRRKIDPRKDPDFDFILKRIESRCQRPERAKTPQP